ncbi:MAG: glycosyltransferase [Nitrospiraceae bacterium]|nr:glycosyltransferase [Nitrospiraceae bacterium]
MTEKPISIVIPAFNQLDYCRACIESLRRVTERAYRLILVDNGSSDGVSEYFDSMEDADVVHTPENLGFPAGSNLGLARAEGHAVLLNSDTLLTPGWLGRLERSLLSAGDLGMVGPMSNSAAGFQQLVGLYLPDQEAVDGFAAELAQWNDGSVRDVNRLVGFCILIRDIVLEKVGLLDESFGIGNYEDDDYATRVRQAGYRLGVAEDCFVFHHGGKTFEGMGLTGERFEALMEENRLRYMEKWDVFLPKPKPSESESEALNLKAREALAAGDAGVAMRFLREAVAKHPTDARNFRDLALLLRDLGKGEMAYQCLVQALRVADELDEISVHLRELGDALNRGDEVAALLAGRGE